MGVTEAQIKRVILEYLTLRKVFCWTNVSGGIWDPIGKRFRKLNGFGMRKGTSDILGIYKGRMLAIEVKSESGRLSEEQKQFLSEVNFHGGIGFMARSVNDVVNNLI